MSVIGYLLFNFLSEKFSTAFTGYWTHTFFGYVTGSNQCLYPLYYGTVDKGSGELSEGKLTGDNW